MTTFPYHQDPGHGWLEVELRDISALGLTRAAFSNYSHVDLSKLRLYLEEDSDMNLFRVAWENRNFKQLPLATVRHDGDCFIRQLPLN